MAGTDGKGQNSASPDVCWETLILLSFENLWGHIHERPTARVKWILTKSCKSKIDKLNLIGLLMINNIFHFDVSMGYLTILQNIDRSHQLSYYLNCLISLQLFMLSGPDMGCQTFPSEQFHDYIYFIKCLNAFMMLQNGINYPLIFVYFPFGQL